MLSHLSMLAAPLAAATVPALARLAVAQAAWPNRPVRVMVDFPLGGR